MENFSSGCVALSFSLPHFDRGTVIFLKFVSRVLCVLFFSPPFHTDQPFETLIDLSGDVKMKSWDITRAIWDTICFVEHY